MVSGAFFTLFFQFTHGEKFMIFVFVGSLIVSLALFKLGQYAAVITIITNAAKLTVLLVVIVAAVLLYWKFRGRIQMPKLPWLSDR
jgi:hypothetical protein